VPIPGRYAPIPARLAPARECAYREVTLDGRILVSGIKFHGFHGLTRIEREIGVRYSVDVEMTCDLKAAVVSDSVKDTIDYRDVHQIVVETGKSSSYHLIETLASRILDAILRKTAASSVVVRVRKETPILDGIVDAVSVELKKDRKRR
jgi:dihydroneopterin aldolase